MGRWSKEVMGWRVGPGGEIAAGGFEEMAGLVGKLAGRQADKHGRKLNKENRFNLRTDKQQISTGSKAELG